MKKKKNLFITIATLLVTILIILTIFPDTITSLAFTQFPESEKISPLQGEAVVGAELYYRDEHIENPLSTDNYHNIHVESRPYLSLDETLALYQPPDSATQNLDLLEIPEGCEVSTNLAYERTLFILINEEREKRGLPLLAWSEQLSNAARKHSIDMACNRFFGHTNLSGEPFQDRISAEGYQYYAVGENIYAGDGVFNSPLRSFNAWYYSSKHFQVMTHTVLTEVGIGYVYSPGSQHGGYFTADFASPE